jgi:hypothetical protein
MWGIRTQAAESAQEESGARNRQRKSEDVGHAHEVEDPDEDRYDPRGHHSYWASEKPDHRDDLLRRTVASGAGSGGRSVWRRRRAGAAVAEKTAQSDDTDTTQAEEADDEEPGEHTGPHRAVRMSVHVPSDGKHDVDRYAHRDESRGEHPERRLHTRHTRTRRRRLRRGSSATAVAEFHTGHS